MGSLHLPLDGAEDLARSQGADLFAEQSRQQWVHGSTVGSAVWLLHLTGVSPLLQCLFCLLGESGVSLVNRSLSCRGRTHCPFEEGMDPLKPILASLTTLSADALSPSLLLARRGGWRWGPGSGAGSRQAFLQKNPPAFVSPTALTAMGSSFHWDSVNLPLTF